MSATTPIPPHKKTYAAALWAVNKVNAGNAWAIQKMGGVAAVAGAILAAVKAFLYTTVGKAMGWLEQRLATAVPIVMGFLASQVGLPEKGVLRQILENLT